VNVGKLKYQIKYIKKTFASSDANYGEMLPSSTDYVIWADMKWIAAKEKLIGDQLTSIKNCEFIFRYSTDTKGINERDAIEFWPEYPSSTDKSEFDILSIQYVGKQNKSYIKVLAQQRS
jgi:head-tail adaptor